MVGNAGGAAGAARLGDHPVLGPAPLGETVRILIPTDGLWRGVVYGLEPPAVILATVGRGGEAMRANPFFADAPPPMAFTIWAAAWVLLVLLGGIALFRRREL